MLVVPHFFRQRYPLRLSRTTTIAPPHSALPALLIIPREGPLRAPHLMVLTGSSVGGLPRGDLVTDDAHIVADSDDRRDQGWHEIADVLVTRQQFAGVLDRYVGCAVAVARGDQGCLIGTRHGLVAEITGTAGLMAGTDPWPATFGSFLYCWLTAKLPLASLASAAIIAGRYIHSPGSEPGEMDVAGRARISLGYGT